VINPKRFEKEYRFLFEKHHYGSTTWSPLAQDFLSGFNNDGNLPRRAALTTKTP